MSKSHSESDELKAIRDLASDEIMSLSDSEIRSRAKDEQVDIDKNASTIRNFLKERIASSKQNRLQQARASLNAVNETSPSYELDPAISADDLRTRLAEIVASGLMANDSRLTLAFRSGGGQEMSENDMRSLLEDFEELKAKKRNESNESS
jgi:hypothetical protein